jgi:nitrogen regulatory protein PII
MATPKLHQMKKIEIVMEGEHVPVLRDLMDQAGVSGYTLIRDVSGMGHHGFHTGRLVYNDVDSYVMAIAVGPEPQIQMVIDGMMTFFTRHSGVLFVSDTAVMRGEYFQAEEKVSA